MRNKGFQSIKLIASISSLILLLNGCSPLSYCKTPKEPEKLRLVAPRHENVDFSEMKYTHYDDSKFEELNQSLQHLMTSESNAEDVYTKFQELYDCIGDISNLYTLSELYTNKDVSNKKYAKEYRYTYNTYMKMYQTLLQTAKDILASPCGKDAATYWSETSIEYYKTTDQATKKQLKLLKKEKELQSKYSAASVNDYSVTINEKEYTKSDLTNLTHYYTADDQNADFQISTKENKELGSIYVDLIKVRNELASSYGYSNYTDYCYSRTYSRDYTPEETMEFNQRIKEQIVPIYLDYYKNEYNPELTNQLDSKFSTMKTEEQLDLLSAYLPQISSIYTQSYQYMTKNHLYDLSASKNKLNLGYTTILTKYNAPYIFNHVDGSFYDFESLVHEFGHYANYYINPYSSNSSLELSEIHSCGLELLYTNFYNKMLSDSLGKTAVEYTLSNSLSTIINGCLYDEFQQKVYQLKKPTLKKVNKLFGQLANEYGYTTDGDNNSMALSWVNVTHNYTLPLYYISYSLSMAPSLEIWSKSQNNFNEAVNLYLKVVKNGNRNDFLKTLKECDLTNPFDDNYVDTLASSLRSALNVN